MGHFSMTLTLFISLSLIFYSFGLSAQERIIRPNVILICVDDLRPELACYGRTHMHTPHIDNLAKQGRLFSRHYVNSPTCGTSRYSLLTGKYPLNPEDKDNSALLNNAQKNSLSPTLPLLFKDNGYTTVAIGKVSHYPGGLSGKDWQDPTQEEMPGAWTKQLMPSGKWKTPQGAMHGMANGITRVRSETPPIEIKEGPDTIYPDGLITNSAIQEIHTISTSKKPWFLAVGFIKPHLPFTAPKKYWELYEDKKLPSIKTSEKPARSLTWSHSSEFLTSYHHNGKDPRKDKEYASLIRRHYYASVSYTDAQVGKILLALEKSGQKENTIIILWGDHGWNLGERSIWGKHNLYEESLHAPLIISTGKMKLAGTSTSEITETADIFPTLCELSGISPPEGLHGNSLVPQLKNPTTPTDGIARSFWKKAQSIRTNHHRLTRQIKNGQTSYNLFLFPETQAPTPEQVSKVSKELSEHFIKT